MLEVVESDFSKALAQAQVEEDDAQREYEKTTMMNKLDSQQKQKDMEYKAKEVVSSENTVRELISDLEGKRTELDAILEYWNSLNSACVAVPESFAERNRRREAEIAGLKEALRILTDEAALTQVSKGALRGVHRHS